ncbi:MAG TPA: D-alanyl-D-alanine carboxypeptidase family protein [bacterium]|nr:D-alanyl-D-alanine carboxypeptidase family protein [bacterium]
MIRVRRWRPNRSRSPDRRWPGAIAALVAVLSMGAAPVPPVSRLSSEPPAVDAAAVVLADASTGRILYAHNAHRRLPPASTTKMMTAILAVEALPLDALVRISARAAVERSGAAIGLEAGDRWKVDDLLHAMLMHSANDAAVALAEAVSGSVEAFVARMNERARVLGARDTHFVTPNGRYHPDHLSSAYDLARIARAALAHPTVARIVALRTWQLTRPGAAPRMLINTNRLLWQVRGADGVKTGWIAESGRCVVGSATRGGRRLIVVLLNAPRMFTDAGRLLEYGFAGTR